MALDAGLMRGGCVVFGDMSDAELEAHIVAAMDERARRRTLADAPRKVRELTQQVLDAEGVTEGEPWRPVILGYPEGHTVTHPVPGTGDTGTWTSMLDNNTWEPGSAGGGWRLQPPGDGRPALWVRPSSTMDAYQDGDVVVFPDYETGRTYRSRWPNPNTWAPDEFPDAWELVEDTAPTPEEPEPEPEPDPEPEPEPDPEPDPEPEPDPGDGDEDEDEGVPVWVRPVWAGAEGGAYAHGERVRYPDANSPIYRSTHQGWNTWAPDEYGWELED